MKALVIYNLIWNILALIIFQRIMKSTSYSRKDYHGQFQVISQLFEQVQIAFKNSQGRFQIFSQVIKIYLIPLTFLSMPVLINLFLVHPISQLQLIINVVELILINVIYLVTIYGMLKLIISNRIPLTKHRQAVAVSLLRPLAIQKYVDPKQIKSLQHISQKLPPKALKRLSSLNNLLYSKSDREVATFKFTQSELAFLSRLAETNWSVANQLMIYLLPKDALAAFQINQIGYNGLSAENQNRLYRSYYWTHQLTYIFVVGLIVFQSLIMMF